MGEPGADVTDNLTEMQKALLGTQTLEQFLQEMATLAARLVTDGVSCGMTMRPTGRPATVACSDPLASEVDEVQYQLDDGPCLHAMRTGDRVRIDDTAGLGLVAPVRGRGAGPRDPVLPGTAAGRGR